MAEGQMYASCHPQGDALAAVQGERSDHREVRWRELVVTSHKARPAPSRGVCTLYSGWRVMGENMMRGKESL